MSQGERKTLRERLMETPRALSPSGMKAQYAYRQGRRAFSLGRYADDCPHRPGTLEAREWMRGWRDADNGR